MITVATIPVVVFAAIVTALLTREQARTVDLGLRGTTRALTAAVDERLFSVIASLRLLGASEEINEYTMREVHRRAVRAVSGVEGWEAIAVATAAGDQLVHTGQPFGTKLPSLADEESLHRAVSLDEPVISGFEVGRVTGARGIRVFVPVSRAGKVEYVLVAFIRSDSLSNLLRAQDIPTEWTAAILDADGVIIARSRGAEQFVGNRATPRLASFVRERTEDVFQDVTQEGQPARGAFSRSQLSGWTVVLGLPEHAVERYGPRSAGIVLFGGIAVLLLGIGIALVVGRRISRPIVALASSAAALGRGESPARLPSSVAEVDQVATALEEAAAQRRRAEETLRRANETFDALIRESPVAIVMIDAGGKVEVANPAAEKLFGCERGGLVGRTLREVSGGRFAELEVLLKRTFGGEPLSAHEWKQEVADGAPLVLQVWTAPLQTQGPSGGYAMAILDDVTERNVALQRLAEERQTVDTLHHIGSALAGELDLQRLVQLLVDEAVELTGAEFGAYFDAGERREELRLYTLSGAPYEAFAHFPAPRPTALFGPTLRGEAAIRIDDVLKDPRYGKNAPYSGMPKGHLPVRSYLAVPVVSRGGEVLGGLFFGHSRPGVFTARHEQLMVSVAAQAAVALDNARLYSNAQAAVRLRDDFLSVASHELKTPLTPLRLQLQMLLHRARTHPEALTPEFVVTTLQRAEGRIEKLSVLIDELLDVSRISAGRLELHPERFDLAALVRDVVAHFDTERARSGSTIQLACDDAVVGEWDRGRMEQVVTNLLTNALKYGQGKPIDITVRSHEGRAFVEVRDRGIGIAAADQQRVFERFERAVSHRQYSGLGLGLWIVRRIVDAFGGEISLQSEPGQGSTFTFWVPLTSARVDASRAPDVRHTGS